MGQLESWVQGVATTIGIAGALSLTLSFALLTGIIAYGASLFRIRLAATKIVIANLATFTSSLILLAVLAPLLLRMAQGASSVVTILVTIVLFVIPSLVLSYILEAAGDLRPNEGPALGLFGYGVFAALVALVTLLSAALLPDSVQSYIGDAKTLVWIILAIGGGLTFAGYSIGSKLTGPYEGPEEDDNTKIVRNGKSGRVTPPPPPLVGWLTMPDGRRLDLRVGEQVIGRTKECTVQVLGDEEISRQHALLRVAQDKVTLQDRGSRNGTYLNDARVMNERVLQDGDRIKVGNSVLAFRSA